MCENKYDLGIIGAGPAGYTAAFSAKKAGLNVVLFEKDEVGGVCLNRGCIPTKTILHSAEAYAQTLNSQSLGFKNIFSLYNTIDRLYDKNIFKIWMHLHFFSLDRIGIKC